MSDVTVVIPTKNEVDTIELTVKEIREELGNPRIIVVDASVDGTLQVAIRLGAEVQRQFKQGKGRAIDQALRLVNEDTNWLVIIDGDYTYPASYIPSMIKILQENADLGMVVGSRLPYLPKFKDRPLYYLRSNLQHRTLVLLHRVLNGVDMDDSTSGLRVIRYDCIKEFSPKAKGFDIEVEINWYVRRKGFKIYEYWIRNRERILGKASRKFR